MKFEFINSVKNGVQFNFFAEIGVVQQLRLLGAGVHSFLIKYQFVIIFNPLNRSTAVSGKISF